MQIYMTAAFTWWMAPIIHHLVPLCKYRQGRVLGSQNNNSKHYIVESRLFKQDWAVQVFVTKDPQLCTRACVNIDKEEYLGVIFDNITSEKPDYVNKIDGSKTW